MIDFVVWATSPAGQTIDKYAELLTNPSCEFWLPITGGTWTTELRQMVAHACYTLIGGLYLRLVRSFRMWPWVLASIVNPQCTPEAKASIAHRLWSSRDCCLDAGFSRKFKRMMPSEADVLGARSGQYLTDVFSQCPVSNVKTETQFGRQRNSMASCRGRWPESSTLASKHVIAELALQHRATVGDAKERCQCALPSRARARPLQRQRQQCAWNFFVQANKSDLKSGRKTMKDLSDEFKAIPEPERLQMVMAAEASLVLSARRPRF